MSVKRLHIPHIGERLILAEDWSFELYHEERNNALIEFFSVSGIVKKPKDWSTEGRSLGRVTIPAPADLGVSRIYIRVGQKEFDSVSFTVNTIIGGRKLKGRFWAKLEDVNRMMIRES